MRKSLLLGAVLASAGAATTGVASGAGPASSISKQGVIVFGDGTNTANRGTYRMNPDGSSLARISTDIYANDVSRGSSPITVVMNAGGDIQALRADGTAAAASLLATAETESAVRMSLDGTLLAWRTAVAGQPQTISIADVVRDGSGVVTGIANAAVVWSGSMQVWGLDFSRDASRIVFSGQKPISGGQSFAPDLYVLDLADSSLEQITDTPEREEWPRWSPVDDRIAYLRRADGGTGVCSLLTINHATRAVKTVLAGSSNQFASYVGGGVCWSPDAAYLMTVVSGYKKPVDLYQFPSAGGKGVNVTGGTSLQPTLPSWGW